ncbi:enhancer of mRNA-decapping 4 isoform X2 [Pelobates cultripes]|uniref:Enhancer of mRNA-decapping 4 isoform X2 n=1 Tax=Pelobates cultripes TaxID=61616 RepID=A0AAD1TIX1_PELCU|nr:enhancer of mRNA-decapping 4 isoform X2 [Pelobates cultripes]
MTPTGPMGASLAQSLSGALCNRLDKTLREEIKKTVPPRRCKALWGCISKVLEPVTGQLSSTIAAKLTAVEGILKENITKMVKSKVNCECSTNV